ncbi:MAG: YqgE/AlgH family protein [Deltaproteobacteria bacterium]|nr:YqgE/AlgH family protein [Deltaproteobacteria bacterium]
MQRTLAPGLLVATPPLNDPNFAHALILLVAHGDEGALGLVVNGERKIAYVGDLLEQLALCDDGSKYREPVRLGGPVQTELGWIVYRPAKDSPREGEIKLSDECAVTQSREVLASIGRGEGPDGYQALLGYTGWAPGQLEEEIRQGAWLPMELDTSIVFEVPIDKRWKVAFEHAGVAPAAMMTSRRGMA